MAVWALWGQGGVINIWPVNPFESLMVIKGCTNQAESNQIEFRVSAELFCVPVLQAGEGLVAVWVLLLHAAAVDGRVLHADVQTAQQDL